MTSMGNLPRRRSFAWLSAVGVALVLVLALPASFLVAALVNNAASASIAEEIADRVAGPEVSVLGTHSEVGRWAGGGNGAMYLSAVIVESSLDEATLAQRVRELGESGEPALRLSVTRTSQEALAEKFTSSSIEDRVASIGGGPDRFVVAQIDSPESGFLYSWDIRGH